jgi:hypothetical protein
MIEIPYNAKTYELTNSIIWMGEDGIVYSIPRKQDFIRSSREQMDQELRTFQTLTGGKKVCMIAVAHPKSESPDKNDRDYISEKLEEITKALAIVTPNAVSRMVANLFFLFKPAAYPMKMFANVDDAKKWLVSEKVNCKSLVL